jgi:hypothetical protein
MPTGERTGFLGLCGPLAVADRHAEADLRVPPGLAEEAALLVAVECLHQISCRLAAHVAGGRLYRPVKALEIEFTGAVRFGPGQRVGAELLRPGDLATVRAWLGDPAGRACVGTFQVQAVGR